MKKTENKNCKGQCGICEGNCKEEKNEVSNSKCVICNMFPQLENTNKCESCYSVIRHSLKHDPRFKDNLLPDVRKNKKHI